MTTWPNIQSALDAGDLAILPTETVYGLAAKADQTSAIDKIYAAKGRAFDKPLALCVRDITQARDFGWFNATAVALVKAHWPGPVTLVVEAKPTRALDPRLTAKSGNAITIAFRCPDVFWRSHINAPLALTSANRSEAVDTTTLDAAKASFDRNIIALPARSPLSGAASTIVRVMDDAPRILRQGETRIAI